MVGVLCVFTAYPLCQSQMMRLWNCKTTNSKPFNFFAFRSTMRARHALFGCWACILYVCIWRKPNRKCFVSKVKMCRPLGKEWIICCRSDVTTASPILSLSLFLCPLKSRTNRFHKSRSECTKGRRTCVRMARRLCLVSEIVLRAQKDATLLLRFIYFVLLRPFAAASE